MDYYWEKHYKHLGKLVRYADDFVVMCETEKQVGEAMKVIESIMGKLELRIHPEKTRIIDIKGGQELFDFLGFTNMKEETISKFGGTFWRTKQVPSKKSMKKMRLKIKGVLGKRANLSLSVKEIVTILNRKIVGMRNYYRFRKSYRHLNQIDWYIWERFAIWYNQKRQRAITHGHFQEIKQIMEEAGLQKMVKC